jgi:opacity protein-like surface antigen
MSPYKIFPIVTVLLLLEAGTALAQSGVGGRGYVTYGTTVLDARDSFGAVVGRSTKSGIGGGGTVTGLWRGVFIDVAVSQQRLEGERVFVDGGTVYQLGIPLTVSLRPIDLAAGWRFTLGRGRVSPYAGAGISVISYEETSAFAQAADDVSEQKTGTLVLGGLDVAVWRWIHVGGDLRYRAVTGVLGLGGVSQLFDEDQLGGFSAGVCVSVGR